MIGVKDLEPLRKMATEGAALSGPVPAAMIPNVAKVVRVNPGGRISARSGCCDPCRHFCHHRLSG